jgi:hypothetical protein
VRLRGPAIVRCRRPHDVTSTYDIGRDRGMTQWGLDALFNPAKRHMDEEKRRLQSTREQIGDSSGGNRIDFESGKVTIKRSTAQKDEAGELDEDEVADEAEEAEEDDGPEADPVPETD